MRLLLAALLTLFGTTSLIVAPSRADTPVPRAPREGLSYLERMFLPEPVPSEEDLAGATDGPVGIESDPTSYLSGSSFTWTSMSPPDGRHGHTAVYDPVLNRVIVFGGVRFDLEYELLNDAWEFRLSPVPKWTYLGATTDRPEPRWSHVAIYDPVGNRMLLWSGKGYSRDKYHDQLWSLDLSGTPVWSRLTTANDPPVARSGAASVYEPTGHRLLMFGGSLPDGTITQEVWELQLGPTLEWHQLLPANSGPGGLSLHSMVLDEHRDRLLVYGGDSSPGSTGGALWSLQLSDPPVWEELSPSGTSPPPRSGHAAVFDAAHDRMIVLAGAGSVSDYKDAWALEFDPAVRWVQLLPTGEGPNERRFPAAVLPAGSDRVFLFGGSYQSFMNDSWFLRTTPGEERWEPASDAIEPGPYWFGRMDHSAVVDSAGDRMIVYGGSGYLGILGDVWELSLSTLAYPPEWTSTVPQGTAPTVRFGHTAIYESANRRMIVFGGLRGAGYLPSSDCWQLSYASSPPTWSQLVPSGPLPVGRYRHAAVFDSKRRRMIVFGGARTVYSTTSYFNDLWVLDLHSSPAWTQVTPIGSSPAARASASLVLDEKHDRIILFGGNNASTDMSDIWALSLNDLSDWESLTPSGESLPWARHGHVAAYDAVNDRMLVYGGCGEDDMDDVWSFSDHSDSPSWVELPVPGGPLRQRCGRSAVVVPGRGALVLYGGKSVSISNNLWALRWDTPVPVQITYASVRRDEDGVVLEWRAAEADQGTFFVDRELPGKSRERISDAVSPIASAYSFLDASNPPAGTMYYLELLDRAGGTTTFGPYELLDTPGVLDIGGQLTATPNPFRAGVKLTASNLPAGDLKIDVCSVSGRVVYQEPTLTGFGGGNAEFQPSGMNALPSGMYFVRVRVGATSVTTKVVKIE